jgi:glycosyltransferase involved in cell wall biosynthesis
LSQAKPKLSVIIPTRNRAKFLAHALQSIEQNDLARDQFEVLVIDNGSTDDTMQVAEQAASRLQNLKVFFEAEPGLHAGRHRGLQEAAGDVLVYADDDIRALPQWLSTLADIFSDPAVAMAGGNNFPDFQGPVPGWLDTLWSETDDAGQMVGSLSILSLPDGRREFSPMYVWGCNFSVRKQVLLDAGGFHPDAMPKERLQFRGDGETHVSRYVQEKGLSCVFDSAASVYHAVTPERMTFDYFRQRAFNQGVSDSYTALRAAKNSPKMFAHSRAKVRRVLSGLTRAFASRNRGAELRQLDDMFRAGYAEGYDWHQQQYRDDSEVRTWVHRADYFV